MDLQFLAHFTTLHLLIFPSYPFWGGHLWYITAIVLCYAIFPSMFASRKLSNFKFLSLYLVVAPLFLFILFYATRMPYRLSGDLYCFIVGFVAARIYKQNPPQYLTIFFVFLTATVLIGDYIALQNDYWNSTLLYKSIHILLPWKKCLFGLTACLILYLPIFDKVSDNFVVNFFDKYSYEIYLAHKNFVIGALSLLYLSNSYALNIILAVLCSIICAFAVQKISVFIQKLIEKQLGL